MDSGWAVVIGAVVAFAGTVLGPWLLDWTKRRSEAERTRRDELSETLPRLFASFTTPAPSADEAEMLVRVQLLLTAEEAPIGNLLISAATNRSTSPVSSAAVTAISMWFRGQLTPLEGAKLFERATGLTVTGPQAQHEGAA